MYRNNECMLLYSVIQYYAGLTLKLDKVISDTIDTEISDRL